MSTSQAAGAADAGDKIFSEMLQNATLSNIVVPPACLTVLLKRFRPCVKHTHRNQLEGLSDNPARLYPSTAEFQQACLHVCMFQRHREEVQLVKSCLTQEQNQQKMQIFSFFIYIIKAIADKDKVF